MVSGLVRGDRPDAKKKPEAIVEDVGFRRVAPHARALLERARVEHSAGFTFENAHGAPYGSPPRAHGYAPRESAHARAAAPTGLAQARSALVSMGYRAREAERLLERVRDRVDDTSRVEEVLRAALRAAPVPSGVREELEEYRRAS